MPCNSNNYSIVIPNAQYETGGSGTFCRPFGRLKWVPSTCPVSSVSIVHVSDLLLSGVKAHTGPIN